MALSDDLRKRVVDAVVEGGISRNAAAKRFGVSIASAVRWVCRFNATGEISPAPTGGDQRSHRIEAHGDYLLGLIRRQPDITLLEIQGRLNANIAVGTLIAERPPHRTGRAQLRHPAPTLGV